MTGSALDRVRSAVVLAGLTYVEDDVARVEAVIEAARLVYETKAIKVPEGAQKRWGDLGAALRALDEGEAR